MYRVALLRRLRLDADRERAGERHAAEQRGLQPGAVVGRAEREVRVVVAEEAHERVRAEAPRDVAVAERRRSAQAAFTAARRERQIELAEGKPRRERRATAEKAAAAFDPPTEREAIAHAAPVPPGEAEPRIVEALPAEVVAAKAHVRRVVAEPVAEKSRGEIVAAAHFLRPAEGVADDRAVGAVAGVDGKVEEIERARLDLLLADENAVHVHVHGRGRERESLRAGQRTLDVVRIEREFARHRQAREDRGAAQRGIGHDRVAGDPAPQVLGLVVGQVGEAAHDPAVDAAGDAGVEEAALPARAGFGKGPDRALVVQLEGVVCERARIAVQGHVLRP
jgi:hypothetical protein